MGFPKKLKTALRILSKSDSSMAAICFKGSRVVSWGTNKYKSLPLPEEFNRIKHRYEEGDGRNITCHRHAEIDAIKKSRTKSIDSIIIVRATKGGDNAKSMPCSMCRKYIEMHSINSIVYFDWDGIVVIEK